MLNASTEAGIDKAFAILTGTKVDGLVIGADAFFIARRDQLVALAAREAVPAIYPFREFTVAGGLMSYGASLPDQYRQVGNTPARFSKVLSRTNYQFCNQRNTSWSSILQRRGNLVSSYRPRCLPSPMK